MKLIDAFLLTVTLYLVMHILFGWEKMEARTHEQQILEHKTKQEVNP